MAQSQVRRGFRTAAVQPSALRKPERRTAVMMIRFITMRRTINLPPKVDALIRDIARDDESFSAAVVRLIEAGIRNEGRRRPPSYVASGDGPSDLGEKAELYLRKLVKAD